MNRMAVALVVLLISPSVSRAQSPAMVDSLKIAFWRAAYSTTFEAQACVGDAMSGGPPSGAICTAARPALEQAFETLARLEVCCSESTRFLLGSREQTMRNLMLAGGGLVYLVAESEALRTRDDVRRKIEIAAALVARTMLAEEQLRALGEPVPGD